MSNRYKPHWRGRPQPTHRCGECGELRRDSWLFWDGDYFCFPSCNQTALMAAKLDAAVPTSDTLPPRRVHLRLRSPGVDKLNVDD